MRNIYKIENSVEKLLKGKYTLFLDEKEYNDIKKRLKKKDYKVYCPFKDSSKVILYKDLLPRVSLFKIKTTSNLRHQDILGALLSLNISSSYIGDIIVDDGNYYFYVLSNLNEYIINNLTYIKNNKILLEMVDINLLHNFQRKYEAFELITSSLRIDSVISKIIKLSRNIVIDKINNKEVLLNYEILKNNSYLLKENDVFSIRKYGKYKYIGVVKSTKKNNFVIMCYKYI